MKMSQSVCIKVIQNLVTIILFVTVKSNVMQCTSISETVTIGVFVTAKGIHSPR